MPKRPNPFGDHSPLQLKTYITQRNVDLGVDKAQNMQSVYERTQSLLMGARQKCRTVCEDDCALGRSPLPTKPLPGQMTLNSCGTLFSCQAVKNIDDGMDCSSEAMHCNNNILPAAPCQDHLSQMCIDYNTGQLVRGEGDMTSGGCHTCHSVQASTTIRPCSYCDKATCVQCLRQCSQCMKIVCKLCSNVSFETGEDCVVCGDCLM